MTTSGQYMDQSTGPPPSVGRSANGAHARRKRACAGRLAAYAVRLARLPAEV